MFLIVGLGNPGKKYENTRHNVGFKVIDELASLLNAGKLKEKAKFNALVGESKIKRNKVILAQPQTFMNLSGDSVNALMKWHKIPGEKIIVIYDDVDLEAGSIKLRMGGGAGGHHGIESIVERIQSKDFIRIRVGIGRPGKSGDVSDYVLSKVPPSEKQIIEQSVNDAACAAVEVVESGLNSAQTKYNVSSRA